MKQKTLSWQDVENCVHEVVYQINQSAWRTDYVIGISRGGLVPALLVSQYLNVPLHVLHVSLRDSNRTSESNLWMAEDAFGTMKQGRNKRKNILIVDDINDTGATFNWIKTDWRAGCFPNDEVTWGNIWEGNVRSAVLVENLDSSFKTCYNAIEVNKAENDVWINFPWESGWWIKHVKGL